MRPPGYRVVDDKDRQRIEEFDLHRDDLESLTKESLIRIVQALSAYIDELTETKRSPEGEEIIKDDSVVEDEDEYL